MSTIDWDLVDRMVDEKFITARPHHALPLTIYNYTPNAQFDKVWNDATLMCRGLVATQCDNRQIVSRPFPKFFNIEEHEHEHLSHMQIPQEPFSVFEKYDGSLFIVSRHGDDLVVATRGSFGSPQAARALQVLQSRYGTDWILPDVTYLFEIIYPENRIVVNYGDREDLVFLAAIHTATGEETLPPHGDGVGIPDGLEQAKVHPIHCLEQLQKIEEDNREGFIVRFQSGLRVKIKFEGYKRLHKLITGLSVKAVWEHLMLGDAAKLETFKVNVPDEFYDWLTKTETELQDNFERIKDEHKVVFAKETADLSNMLTTDRKTAAMRFSSYAKRPETGINKHILFAMMTGKKLDEIIWKGLRPVGNSVFKADTDESVNA